VKTAVRAVEVVTHAIAKKRDERRRVQFAKLVTTYKVRRD
jgi:hypothetical protein